MNPGLLYKSFRETWPLTLVCGLGVFLFEAIITYVLVTYSAQFLEMWSNLEFARGLIEALIGTEITDSFGGPQQLVAVAWVHPGVLALLWAHEITFCTRVPAGEIERGTSDILLGWPVPRWKIIASETTVWLASGIAIVALGIFGHLLGQAFTAGGVTTPGGRLPPIVLNMFAMYLAVGGVAWFTSVLCDRRARAIAIAFGVVIVSFMINFIVPFWEPAEYFAFLSLLHYYQPLEILGGDEWPVAHIVLLTGIGVALWSGAVAIFARRNVSTT